MKKWLAIVIGAIDAALLMVILISVVTGWRIGAPQTQTNKLITQPAQSGSDRNSSAASAARQTEGTDGNLKSESDQKATEKTTEKTTEKPAQTQTEAPKASYPQSGEVSTSEGPALSDIQGFKWDKDKGAYWSTLTSSAAKLNDFEAVQGGWKAYLLDDPSGKRIRHSVEHFANISISGSASVTKATIDWIYATATDEGDGHDDSSPDSVFNGSWSDGAFSGLGAGRLTLNNFYYESGREYGVGIYTLPDGVESIVALVRP